MNQNQVNFLRHFISDQMSSSAVFLTTKPSLRFSKLKILVLKLRKRKTTHKTYENLRLYFVNDVNLSVSSHKQILFSR